MTAAEIALLISVLRRSKAYLEFGSGGSTVLACEHVSDRVISVDSSREWLAKVEAWCVSESLKISPTTVHVDIGPTKEWGWPVSDLKRKNWPLYHSAVWDKCGGVDACLIDGRFRVACFLQALLHLNADAILMIHDFSSRIHYHIIVHYAREIAICDDLSLFVKRSSFDATACAATLRDFQYDPA